MLMREGRRDEAVEQFERTDRQSDGSSQPAALGYVLTRFADAEKSRYVPPTSFALVHAGFGERDATLSALERAYLVRDVRMTLLPDDAQFRSSKTIHGLSRCFGG
jgi:hypothetical protein